MTWKKDYNQVEEDDSKQSRINAAALINSTLERLWNESYTAMASGDYHKWNVKLDSIWAILGGDEKKGSPYDEQFNEMSLKIYELGSLKSHEGSGFNKKSNANNALQYQWLLRKSIWLRRLQNKQGKGTAYASDDEDDID